MTDEKQAASPVDELFVKAHQAILFDTSLSANDLRVYLGFRHFARPERGKMTVYPSIQTLAKHLNLSTRQVDRSIATLASKGLIERKQTRSTALTTLTRLSCVYENLDHVPGKAKVNSGASRHANVAGLDTPPAADRSRRSEVDNDPAEKPREPSVKESPKQRPLPEARPLTVVPAEEIEPYNSLARRKKPREAPKKHLSLGGAARRLWEEQAVPAGLPPLSDWEPGTLVKAGKTAELRHSRFEGKPLEELFPLILARVKTCDTFWRKKITFGFLFCANAPNLAKLLSGEWDQGGQEPERPKRREVPLEDLTPGMDEPAYWDKKDKEAGR